MAAHPTPIQHLITLPPRMAAEFAELEQRPAPWWFAAADPPGAALGSGGGTAHLLVEAWRATGPGTSFSQWLHASRKLVIHGAGHSDRLPAYATVGRPLLPLPVFRWSRGQRLEQTLLDLQLPEYQRVLAQAPSGTVVLVASGDVLPRFGQELPPFPAVDVLGLGMWLTPETAKDFGVFFSPREKPGELAFFLQKPAAARIRELAADYLCLVDTGMWLLSERAVNVLLARCGWDAAAQRFPHGRPSPYELYAQLGLGLGQAPTVPDPGLRELTCAVAPLPQPEFYHFGASRQIIQSVSALQYLELDETKLGLMGAKRHLDQHLQNAPNQVPLRREENHTLWIENSFLPAAWTLAYDHVLTGVPENTWSLRLEPGVCLDFVPVGEQAWCLRAYGMDDTFKGRVSEAETLWLGRPAADWFRARGLTPEAAGVRPTSDLRTAPLFPVLSREQWDGPFLEWCFARQPAPDTGFAQRWLAAERLSAQAILARVNLARLYRQRTAFRSACLRPMLENSRWSVFLNLDLESAAKLYAASNHPLPPPLESKAAGLEPMRAVHEQMFRAAVMRRREQSGWEEHEQRAFALLREMIVRETQLAPVLPRCQLIEDQIIWGRSPVRLDLAGGWTDTPPYCLEHGGRVLNVAVDLNGQPPIQVFAKLSSSPELVVRSIDLGVEQRITRYEELDTYDQPGSGFAVAKAAFALAGFLPRFHARGGCGSLARQLQEFGGGIELSMLSAVPKGSGLGTSSILAATLLATLGELCGLGWDRHVWFSRTLALEQMLTTGGGWQDQAGGIFRGIKLVQTAPGLSQRPTVRWLPDHLFEADDAHQSILLYYTGLTRLAKNILQEIVRGIFLNSPAHLGIVDDIGANAEVAFAALQKSDYAALCDAIRNSWRLNQALDAGTNPPEVEAILNPLADYLAATKLLGAGGGGYLLMLAKDPEAAERIRALLAHHPPNPRARLVDFRVSATGLQLTRS